MIVYDGYNSGLFQLNHTYYPPFLLYRRNGNTLFNSSYPIPFPVQESALYPGQKVEKALCTVDEYPRCHRFTEQIRVRVRVRYRVRFRIRIGIGLGLVVGLGLGFRFGFGLGFVRVRVRVFG